jgi:hypothetical protein
MAILKSTMLNKPKQEEQAGTPVEENSKLKELLFIEEFFKQ